MSKTPEIKAYVGVPEALGYGTTIPIMTLRKLLFQGLKSSGDNGKSIDFDWREQKNKSGLIKNFKGGSETSHLLF